jgi:formylglycine-generating enzyme required for sulfatase activity
VTLSSFELDRHEVTVARYGQCVEAGRCNRPAFHAGDLRFDQPNLPVTHVRWDDAVDYCVYAGGRLPTEAEWEYAARGARGRAYPWGDVYNGRRANHGSLGAEDTDASDGFADLAPVGSFPSGQTPEGILDMAGNAGEWVADYFSDDAEGFGYAAAPVTNPKGSVTGTFRVIRGGSYRDGAPFLRSAARARITIPHSPAVGFRCAYDVR